MAFKGAHELPQPVAPAPLTNATIELSLATPVIDGCNANELRSGSSCAWRTVYVTWCTEFTTRAVNHHSDPCPEDTICMMTPPPDPDRRFCGEAWYMPQPKMTERNADGSRKRKDQCVTIPTSCGSAYTSLLLCWTTRRAKTPLLKRDGRAILGDSFFFCRSRSLGSRKALG